jgi:predicted anti-sigma-YlaC factor YlaD
MNFSNSNFMQCEQVLPNIVLYIDHEILDEQQLSAVELHFGVCQDCRNQMEQESAALVLMKNLLCNALNEEIPENLFDRITQQTEDLYKQMKQESQLSSITEITYTQTTYTEITSDGATQIEITSEIRREFPQE